MDEDMNMAEELGIEEFLESEKGKGWFGSSVIKKHAMDFYTNHMLLQAWNAVHCPTQTVGYMHCKKELPNRTADVVYFSMVEEPLIKSTTIKFTYKVDIYDIVPYSVSGRFGIKFKLGSKWFKMDAVPYTSFDPFIQFWLKRGYKEGLSAYSLDKSKSIT